MTEHLKGEWWHPSKPDKVVAGVLTVGSGEGPLLELIGALADPFDSPTWPETSDAVAPALHGFAEGKHVTIFRAYEVGTKTTLATTHSVVQEIKTEDGVLVGGDRHIAGIDESVFRVLEVELDYLTFWSDMAITSSRDINFPKNGNLGETIIKVTDSAPIVARAGGFTIELSEHVGSKRENKLLGSTRAQIEERAVVRIISDHASPAKDFLRPMRTIQNLVTHAMRKPSGIRSIKLYENSEAGIGLAYNWYRFDPSPSEEAIPERASYGALFTVGKVDFEKVVDRWFNLTTQLHSSLDILIGLDYEPRGFYENKLLNAASATEAFHRELLPGSVGMDASEYQRIKGLIKSALPKEDRDILSNFSNSPGYVQRCVELAKVPDEQAVTELLGDVAQWATWLKNARNNLAHVNPQEKRNVPEDAWYQLATVTKALLHLVLMEKLGLSAEAQRRAVHTGALEFAARGYKAARQALDPAAASDDSPTESEVPRKMTHGSPTVTRSPQESLDWVKIAVVVGAIAAVAAVIAVVVLGR